MRGALSQVTDWKDLQQKIQTARQKENTRNPRVTRFWLPSLLTLTLVMSIPMVLARLGLDSNRLLALRARLILPVIPLSMFFERGFKAARFWEFPSCCLPLS